MTLLIQRTEQLRAMRAPVKRQILFALEDLGAASVAELAERLHRSPESLAYHVRSLVRAGFLVEREKRSIGGRAASVYGLSDQPIQIDQQQRSPRFFEALAELYKASLRWSERALLRGLEQDRKLPKQLDRRCGVMQAQVRLDQRGLRKLRKALIDCALEAQALDEPNGELLELVTIVFCPVSDSTGDS